MRKENMKVLKKIKISKIKNNLEQFAAFQTPFQTTFQTADLTVEILINSDNSFYKNLIVNFALNNFLKNKRASNATYLKYLRNFQIFSNSSLLSASYYLQNSQIDSKGDIKTFIYLFFAFNLVSSKYLDDYSIWNKSFIKLWGVSLFQASQLEMYALKNINYELFIDVNRLEESLKQYRKTEIELNNESIE
jgi:hypothetical protein